MTCPLPQILGQDGWIYWLEWEHHSTVFVYTFSGWFANIRWSGEGINQPEKAKTVSDKFKNRWLNYYLLFAAGLVQCGKKALLQLNPNSNLLKSWEMLCKNFQNCNIHCIMQYVPHSSLFPLCQSVVHHGGSGTVGMALTCGIPQVVCPFMFDQSYWGDKVSWMGVGESVGHPRSLKPEPFASALVNVSSNDIRSMAASYGKMLQKEKGVEYAVQQLVKEFSTLW